MDTAVRNNLMGAKNIGPTILKHLHEIDIYSLADLAETTPAKAYEKICKQNPGKTFPVCYYLYSLQGALHGLHWNELPNDLKKDLLKQLGR